MLHGRRGVGGNHQYCGCGCDVEVAAGSLAFDFPNPSPRPKPPVILFQPFSARSPLRCESEDGGVVGGVMGVPHEGVLPALSSSMLRSLQLPVVWRLLLLPLPQPSTGENGDAVRRGGAEKECAS